MENKLIHFSAFLLAERLNRYLRKDGLALKKLELGMEILLINVSKIIIVYILAALLGTVVQTFILHTAYVLVRRYSYGLHALNTTVCTLMSCCLFVLAPRILYGVEISNPAAAAGFILIIYCLYRYAPADTKSRPLVGAKMRARLKRNAVISGFILMIAALVIPNESVKFLLVLGAAYQCISIMPFTYKLLKRSAKNYENYEHA